MKITKIILSLMLLCSNLCCHAAYTIFDGTIFSFNKEPIQSAETHFGLGCDAMEKKQWHEAARQFSVVSEAYPDTALGKTANYYFGVSLFYLYENEFANDAFSRYLKFSENQEHFESAMEFKLSIANRLSRGAKCRVLGMKYMPALLPGDELALQIYDEICSTLPCHDLAAWALFCKGDFLWRQGCYSESIETFQQLTRRFPKHELAPESYLAISYIYVDQSCDELDNADLLPLAQINLKRFKSDFPREERVELVEANIIHMQERYAFSLYETGRFYERKERPQAASVYYKSALDNFPETKVAKSCKDRLNKLPRAVKCEDSQG